MELRTITSTGKKKEMPKTVKIGETDFPVYKDEFEMVQKEELSELKEKLWLKLMDVGRDKEVGISHNLSPTQVNTILKSIPDSVNENKELRKQIRWDLTTAKYPLYDEIGTLLNDRTAGYPYQTPKSEEKAEKWAIEIAEDYLGCSNVSNTQEELYDCISNRIEKRLGINPEIPKKYDFSAEEVIKNL